MNLDRKNRTARVSFTTYPDAKEAFKAMAAEMDIPVASLMRMLINEALRARGLVRRGPAIVRKVA
jgi:antitoxin component of RelBE/YafQ-DinJ toxin-antitoxin module